MTKPIVFERAMSVQYGNLDPYGHVYSPYYLDFVISSRWLYSAERFQLGPNDFVKADLGFFLTRSEIDYRKPLVGLCEIMVRSHVEVTGETRITVPFAISQPANVDHIYASGVLHLAVVDLKLGRPTPLPEWVKPYFFEATGG